MHANTPTGLPDVPIHGSLRQHAAAYRGGATLCSRDCLRCSQIAQMMPNRGGQPSARASGWRCAGEEREADPFSITEVGVLEHPARRKVLVPTQRLREPRRRILGCMRGVTLGSSDAPGPVVWIYISAVMACRRVQVATRTERWHHVLCWRSPTNGHRETR
jgi:hypothetical protein